MKKEPRTPYGTGSARAIPARSVRDVTAGGPDVGPPGAKLNLMIAGALPGMHARPRSPGSFFVEGFRMMRESLPVYLAFALVCAVAAAVAFPRTNLLRLCASGDPLAIVKTLPLNVVVLLALVALFFILPSALRRIEPSFRMTAWRTVVAFVTIGSIGAVTELGYAAAILPGVIAGVLLSQVLIGTLLRTGEPVAARRALRTLVDACRGSFELTRGHFATTLCVLVLSLAVLAVPFVLALTTAIVLDDLEPRSLVLTAPLLFLTFIYFECVRYALIVWWYRRLAADVARPAPLAR
jgi:hypothetical protein